MLKLQRFVSVSHSLSQLYKVVKHPESVSNRIIWFNKIVCNSGCLIAGCCFSRQSEEETLLPNVKNNHGIPKIETADYLHTHSNVEQHLSNSKNMKRSFETVDDIASQQAIQITNADLSATQVSSTYSKRKKTADGENDIVEEKQSDITECPTSESTDRPAQFEKNKVIEKPKKHQPNYFVAVQISDDQIHETLSELQQHMLLKEERLKKSMIPLATLHITLMVMYIGDIETHERAMRTLQNIHREHNDDLSTNPIKLEFKGLSHFQNRVLYAKLLAGDSYRRLTSLAESVKKHFTLASIPTTDSRTEFTPHLTIAKIRFEQRNSKNQNKFVKKIDPELYKDFNEQYFGCQKIKSIQLLSMTDPKNEAGYYSGNEIYFSAFEPSIRRDCLNKVLQTEEKKKNIKEIINSLTKEKLK